MDMLSYVFSQLAAVLVLAPLAGGIIKKVKAFSQKRKGPPVIQMYFDLYKLLHKDTVISQTASWIYRFTPYLNLTTSLLAALFIPVTVYLHTLSFRGDIILVVYLLALGRFFMTLAALDTGSTFGGMGSSREVLIAALMEPALMVSLFTLGLKAGSTSVYEIMLANSHKGAALFDPFSLLLFAAVFIILLAETARIPVDDPSTHLELTMVHEAMLLEYSGKHLAMMELAAAVKQLIFITVLVNLFLPLETVDINVSALAALGLGLALYIAKVVLISVLIAIVEISTVKLRFFSVPNLAAISFALSFLGFMQFFVIGR